MMERGENSDSIPGMDSDTEHLAVQIRQSRQLERAASIREKFAKGSDMVGYTALHPEKLETIRRGAADFSQLSVEEIDVFNGWGVHCLVTIEQAM
jgi:hypothetical protein